MRHNPAEAVSELKETHLLRDEPYSLFRILSQAADGAFVVADNQRIVFWNMAAQELLGYTPAEVLNRSCCEILRGRDDNGLLLCHNQCPVITATLVDDVVPSFDLYVRTQSGAGRWINLSILTCPSPHERGGPLTVHLFRDASEKKRNEEFINQVLAATTYLRQPDSLASQRLDAAAPELINLTDREREVLSLLAQGLSTADIAQSLVISLATARNHVQNILSKLHVHSRLQAVAYALEHHLIPPA